jgi:hypothetical protein
MLSVSYARRIAKSRDRLPTCRGKVRGGSGQGRIVGRISSERAPCECRRVRHLHYFRGCPLGLYSRGARRAYNQRSERNREIENSRLVSYVCVEHACLNLAASLDLHEQPILAGLRKPIRERNFGGN